MQCNSAATYWCSLSCPAMAVNEHRASGAATFLPEVLDKAASGQLRPHIGSTKRGTEKRLQTMGSTLAIYFRRNC